MEKRKKSQGTLSFLLALREGSVAYKIRNTMCKFVLNRGADYVAVTLAFEILGYWERGRYGILERYLQGTPCGRAQAQPSHNRGTLALRQQSPQHQPQDGWLRVSYRFKTQPMWVGKLHSPILGVEQVTALLTA